MSAFAGYPGQVWAASWISMNWFTANFSRGITSPVAAVSAAQALLDTFRNGAAAVGAWYAAALLTAEAQNLLAIETLPLAFDTATQAFLTTRITALSSVAVELTVLPPIDLRAVTTLLAGGTPAIADPEILEWRMQFNEETPPTGFSASDTITAAAAAAQAWENIAEAIFVLQGDNTTQSYDAAMRMSRASRTIADHLAALTSGPIATGQAATPLWNQMVAVPSILLDAASLATPSTLIAQQCSVIRYTLGQAAFAMARLLLALRRPGNFVPVLAELRQNDSLIDVAARDLGNFEQWAAIAALNSLTPPYPGPANPSMVGQKVFLPTGSPLAFGLPLASYADNVLGVDLDIGPINGVMPAWTGDFQTVAGYQNYARALGRRIQTTLGALVYHSDYGSRIPPEVGAVQSIDEAERLKQFGVSAVRSDPRTGTVISAQATTQPGFLATFQALVQPIGPGLSPVGINEVLNPLP